MTIEAELHPLDHAPAEVMTGSVQRTWPLTATIVGRGRVGRALAAALRAADVRVAGPTMRGEVVTDADVILVCVPDTEIAGMIATLRETSGLVGHLSGATSLAHSGADFALHPMQTFAGEEGAEAFRGIGCAVAGRTPAALAAAAELAVRIGSRPFPIEEESRAGYHAAACFASNFVITVLAAAEQVAETAGLSETDARLLLAPIVRRTVENWAVLGPAAALTGPIARGDEQTVQRQRRAIAVDALDLLPLFDALTVSTRTLAARSRETR
jgi:predicted short-subunit dehydrogenase-like oxidoreductase (DUF2520 family)